MGVTELFVIKKDQTKELYNREKLQKSIVLAFAKRPTISTDIIYAMITNLEVSWLEKGTEVTSQQIGEDVMNALKTIDFVAYIRFASVYQEFDTIDDFKHFIS